MPKILGKKRTPAEFVSCMSDTLKRRQFGVLGGTLSFLLLVKWGEKMYTRYVGCCLVGGAVKTTDVMCLPLGGGGGPGSPSSPSVRVVPLPAVGGRCGCGCNPVARRTVVACKFSVRR